MDCFEDYTVRKGNDKEYFMIPKREFNPELSAFKNLILDLVDFKDRVRPLARDITLLDATHRYQARPMTVVEEELKEFDEIRKELGYDKEHVPVKETKREISERSSEEAAVPFHERKQSKKWQNLHII